MDGCMDDGWMDGWMMDDGWMDGWIVQVVLRNDAGRGIQGEGDTKWSSELGVEGLFREGDTELVLEGLFGERETPSGPQNWGWRGYSERGRHQVVHRIGVASCCE